MTWTKKQDIGSRDSLMPSTTPIFAPVGSAKSGGVSTKGQTTLPRTENLSKEKGDTENEQPTSTENTDDGFEEDTEEFDDPNTWLKTLAGKSNRRTRGIPRNQPTIPGRTRLNPRSIAKIKDSRYPPRGDWPTIESGADVTIA